MTYFLSEQHQKIVEKHLRSTERTLPVCFSKNEGKIKHFQTHKCWKIHNQQINTIQNARESSKMIVEIRLGNTQDDNHMNKYLRIFAYLNLFNTELTLETKTHCIVQFITHAEVCGWAQRPGGERSKQASVKCLCWNWSGIRLADWLGRVKTYATHLQPTSEITGHRVTGAKLQ